MSDGCILSAPIYHIRISHKTLNAKGHFCHDSCNMLPWRTVHVYTQHANLFSVILILGENLYFESILYESLYSNSFTLVRKSKYPSATVSPIYLPIYTSLI